MLGWLTMIVLIIWLVTKGDEGVSKIYGKSTTIVNEKNKIEDHFYVKGIKHNIYSVINMYIKRYNLLLHEIGCEMKKRNSRRLVTKGTRIDGNFYHLKGSKRRSCLMDQANECWIWHKRMGHINFDNMVKIGSTHVVRDMPRIIKPTNTSCKEYQMEKKTRVQDSRSSLLQNPWSWYILTYVDLYQDKITQWWKVLYVYYWWLF